MEWKRIIMMGDTKQMSPKFFEGLCFYHIKEIELSTNLHGAIMDLTFALQEYKDIQTSALKEDKQFNGYQNDFKSAGGGTKFQLPFEVAYRKAGLRYHLGMFLFLTKTVLDKLMPLVVYRYNIPIDGFHKKGKPFINLIKGKLKDGAFASVIQHEIDDWLLELIELRDEYVHHSELKEYTDFAFSCDNTTTELPSLDNFAKPSIKLKNGVVDALTYMNNTYDKMAMFVNVILKYCKYDKYNKPPIKGKCDCGFKFGEFSNKDKTKIHFNEGFDLKIEDRELKLGTLICPKCGKRYSTDLEFWQKFHKGFSLDLSKNITKDGKPAPLILYLRDDGKVDITVL